MVIGGVFEPWNDDVLSGAWELYAAPVDAKAIRKWVDLTEDEALALAKQSEGKSRHWLVWSVSEILMEKNK